MNATQLADLRDLLTCIDESLVERYRQQGLEDVYGTPSPTRYQLRQALIRADEAAYDLTLRQIIAVQKGEQL
jgi:hypothetical protein